MTKRTSHIYWPLPPSDGASVSQTQELVKECNTVGDYEARRHFYGYLTKANGDDMLELGISDFEAAICEHTLYSNTASNYGDIVGINLGVFNNIHKQLPELRGDEVSLFNLYSE